MQELLAYDPARLRALALRTAAAIQWLDAPSSTEPLAQDAVATLRGISHLLSTTWMPWFTSVLGDTSMTAWDSDGPATGAPAARGFAGSTRSGGDGETPEEIANDMVDLAEAIQGPGADLEALLELNDLLAEHGDDPSVMAAFARLMGPEVYEAFVVALTTGTMFPLGFPAGEYIAARDGVLAALLPTPLNLATNPDFDLSEAVSLNGDGTTSWDNAFNPGCVTFPGGGYGGGGFVTGADGRQYPIVVPSVPSDDEARYTSDLGVVDDGEPCVGNLNGTDPGWTPIGYQSGIERFQNTPTWQERMAGFFAGTTGMVRPLLPSDGLQFVQMRPQAVPYLASGPPGAPSLAGSPGPSLTDAVEGQPSAQAVMDIAVRGADGWVFAASMDNQRERAYQVIYEQNGDRIRARIVTYTLGYDSNDEIVIVPEHVWVNQQGDLMSQLVTYQTPDGVDAVWSDMTDAAFTTDQAPAPYDIDPQAFP